MSIKFRPQMWPTVATLLGLAVLVSLGTWQVQRLAWKTEAIARIESQMAQPPVPMPETIDDPAAWNYRRVSLTGRFLHSHEFLVKPRVLDGQGGYHMIVPFRRVSGGIVFVNRGWIADSVMDAATRPEGIVQIEAVLYAPEKYRFTPENVPEKNDWYWEDVSAMAQAAQLDAPAPAVAIIAERAPGVYPAGGVLRLDIPNNHRQYALFWYGMAAVLLVFYIVFSCSDAARTEKNA